MLQAAQAVFAHGADADEAECARRLRPEPFQRHHGGGGAADRIGPVLVEDAQRVAGARIGEHDVARAVEPADGVGDAVVVIGVEPQPVTGVSSRMTSLTCQ